MNVVTFNDHIRAMAGNKHRPATLPYIEKMFPGWESSPLFMYDEPESESEASAIVKGHMEDVFEAFPFPTFRLDVTVGEKGKPSDWGKYKAKAIVSSYDEEGPAILARIDRLMHNETTYEYHRWTNSKALPIFFLVYSVKQDGPGSCDFNCNENVLFGIRGVWDRVIPPYATTYINGFLKSLAAFNLSAMSHNNHVVEVTPNQEGRSVEWLKARTHYTLITHGHPANNPGVGHGTRVPSDPDKELTRMAHNRRAHKRTLRSSRFTYARGKTIDVKATWVGPKEWKDEGGHQVYKILEPVEGASIAA